MVGGNRSRAPSKTGFFEAARNWRLAAMARTRPALVAARDGSGRTALQRRLLGID